MNTPNYLDKVPIYSLFILILIISANFLAQLFPCRLQKVLNNNIYIKHIFAFLTLVFFVVLTVPLDDKSLNNIFQKSFIIYIWFLLIMKTDKYFFLSLLLIIAIIYILVLQQNEYNKLLENKDITHQNKLLYTEKLNNITYINNKLFIITVILTFIGFLLYMGEKKCEYKYKFNYLKFIFGQPQCRNKSPPINYIKAIQCIFI
jgi:hypothetical protein